MTLIGVLSGTGMALMTSRWLRSLLFGISVTEPLSVVIAVASMIVAAAVAIYLPARRAAKLAPAAVLRAE